MYPTFLQVWNYNFMGVRHSSTMRYELKLGEGSEIQHCLMLQPHLYFGPLIWPVFVVVIMN